MTIVFNVYLWYGTKKSGKSENVGHCPGVPRHWNLATGTHPDRNGHNSRTSRW